mmetsp:Transcript_12702/g.31199  ORF Transcript_12702/g.31199 Transcript_12702/m.31199 type:complete len:117 (+) Transcript_12702:3-353(+)
MNKNYLRLFDTNIDTSENFTYGLKRIKGLGIRFTDFLRKTLNINHNFSIKDLDSRRIEKISDMLIDPAKYKTPKWLLNKRKDIRTGENIHILSSVLDASLREDIERLIKSKLSKLE